MLDMQPRLFTSLTLLLLESGDEPHQVRPRGRKGMAFEEELSPLTLTAVERQEAFVAERDQEIVKLICSAAAD